MMYLGQDAVGINSKILNIANGNIIPTEDAESYTIDTHKDFTVFIIELKDATMVAGKRNFGYLILTFNGDIITSYYGGTSNAAGNSWGSVALWNKTGTAQVAQKNGTTITINVANMSSGAKFFANTEYEWRCW